MLAIFSDEAVLLVDMLNWMHELEIQDFFNDYCKLSALRNMKSIWYYSNEAICGYVSCDGCLNNATPVATHIVLHLSICCVTGNKPISDEYRFNMRLNCFRIN